MATARLVHQTRPLGKQRHRWKLVSANGRSTSNPGEWYANEADALRGALLSTGAQFVGPSGNLWSLRYETIELLGWSPKVIDGAMAEDGITD